MQRTMVFWLIAIVLPGPLAQAQQGARIPRIGYLAGFGDANNPGPYVDAFRQALRDLGYAEGKNINIEYRSADGKGAAREAQLAEELVRLNVDLIVVTSLPAIRAAKKASQTLPVVMITSTDPVAAGLVKSLARPGGNVTGVTRLTRELAGKRLELLKEMLPKISRVGILLVADATSADDEFRRYESEGRGLKLQVQRLEVRSEKPNLAAAFDSATKARVNALITMSYAPLNRQAKFIAELGLKRRLPVMFERRDYVEAGGLASYTADEAESHRRVAVYVDKILKGTKPADLPVEQPMKFEFVINLKTAKQIGVTIPPNVLVRADQVLR